MPKKEQLKTPRKKQRTKRPKKLNLRPNRERPESTTRNKKLSRNPTTLLPSKEREHEDTLLRRVLKINLLLVDSMLASLLAQDKVEDVMATFSRERSSNST